MKTILRLFALSLCLSAFGLESSVNEAVPSRVKSPDQVQVDNAYMFLCSYLGSTNKLTIAQLTYAGVMIGTTNMPVYRLLKDEIVMVDAAGKRNDAKWWDVCEYHPEYGSESNMFIQLIMFDFANIGR